MANWDNFVVDIGVVFAEDQLVAAGYMDKKKVLWYFARGKNGADLKKEFETLLEGIEGIGIRKPLILEKWFTGEYESKKCLELVLPVVDTKIASNPKSTRWKLMHEIALMMFDAGKLSDVLRLDKNAMEFVRKKKREGAHVYLAGNMDKKTFEMIKLNNRDFFTYIDGYCISGIEKKLKPQVQFFATLVDKFALIPYKTVLVEKEIADLSTIGIDAYRLQDLH